MKERIKRRSFADTPSLLKNADGVDGWRFLIITDTVCMSGAKSVFLTNGDLVILRPGEGVSFMPDNRFVGVNVSGDYVKRCLDLFSTILYDKWCDSESLIISLSGAGREYVNLIINAKNAPDIYTGEFLIKQAIVGCIAEMVRKDKYGQQALPQIVLDALELMKQPEVIGGTFSAFRKKMGMSESHLARLFAKYNLEVPSEVFRKAKFEQAKQWIEDGIEINAVAKQIGYTVKSFKKIYAEYYGKTLKKK